jgi:4-hydroxy-tetrahydrodipicolinate reductase
MKPEIRVLQVGLGPIGLDIARRGVRRKGLRFVGGVDHDPALAGRSLAELLGGEAECEGPILASAELASSACSPDVAVVATTSDLAIVAPMAEGFLRAGVSVVSTCEELIYPFISAPEIASRLDEAGRTGGAACLGTGINPGFVLDLLPAILSAPVDRVDAIRCWRIVDAAVRRGPLQKKVGAGLSVEEFEARVRQGAIGHRGFAESLHLLCSAFGVGTSGATTFIRPVIAEADVVTEHVQVSAGQVAGVHQGAEDRNGRVLLDLKMYVGAQDPHDRIEIDGDPSVRVQVEGGYFGDTATSALVLNAIPGLLRAAPGLRTMLDLPPLHAPPMPA